MTAFKSSLVLKCLYLCHITIRTSLKVKDNVGSGGLKGRGMGSPCHPLLGGPKINISAELSFFKSKLTLTVGAPSPPPTYLKILDLPLVRNFM